MKKLLTIDDEPEFTELIEGYFGQRGYKVFKAGSGEVGLEIAKQEKPDICLIDIKMPGMHGDEALKEILLLRPDAKCIVVAASEGQGKTKAHMLALGALAYFEKPLHSLRDLEKTIERLISR
ncbi:MAG: response regulator [Candidatus Omnitrophica bacterium]|nr:response regulator [Candidatus Omnitrophota bacterium]